MNMSANNKISHGREESALYCREYESEDDTWQMSHGKLVPVVVGEPKIVKKLVEQNFDHHWMTTKMHRCTQIVPILVPLLYDWNQSVVC